MAGRVLYLLFKPTNEKFSSELSSTQKSRHKRKKHMPIQIQFRRGTSAEHETFTGAPGEITVDTTNNTLRVHDGQTPGGTTLAKRSEIPDLTPLDYIIESGRTDTMWWRKYKSGAVDMGGHYTGNAKTITLPIKLANTNYEVLLTKNDAVVYWATTHITVGTRTTDKFVVATYGDSATMRIAWQITNAIAATE